MLYKDEENRKVFVKILAYPCHLYDFKTSVRPVLNNNFKIAPGPHKHSVVLLRKNLMEEYDYSIVLELIENLYFEYFKYYFRNYSNRDYDIDIYC